VEHTTAHTLAALQKSATGIEGLDEVTRGGLPTGRPTLVCGAAGSGKTLLGMSFLVNGASMYGEPGVLMTFEETAEEIARDVKSLGFDLKQLVADKKLFVDFVRIERSEIEETGDYDLEALFIRLEHAIRSVGAKRVVLDTIEALFSGLTNAAILRAELRRLFRWLKDRGMTTVITGERGEGTLTRNGLEEYVSDAVILLDHRVHEQVSTRRLRIVKYRGSHHGTNEYPFLIGEDGISVLPVTSLGLQHDVRNDRVSTGIAPLDSMLGGLGFYRGSTILISGTAGTGKTSVSMHFVDAACRRGERCLVFLSEESSAQVMRNMRSIGLELGRWVSAGLLNFQADRPSRFGLESHLTVMHRAVQTFSPSIVVVDPITNLLSVGTQIDVEAMLTRMIDFLKVRGMTAVFTSLTSGKTELHQTDAGVSSLMDSWVLLTARERDNERVRKVCILKSRGMAHSNQIREFAFTEGGFHMQEPPAMDVLTVHS
jgi:circadian clock protein KaiC